MSSPVAFSLFDGQPEWSEMALVVAVTFLLASIVSSFTARLVRVLLTKIYGKAAEGAPALVSRPVLVTRLVTFLLVFAVTTIPTLDGIGEHFDVGLDSQTAFRWALASGFRIIIIVTLAWLVIRMVTTSSARLERELARSTSGMDDRLKRAQTLGGLIQNVTTALVCGVALGFGAQWLVRDLISGFFLILEDQVRVGDGVVINGQGGSVEAINLRTVVLRDVEGAVHIFPNGAITTLANKTRDFAFALVDLAVDFQTDSDRVVQVLRDTAAKLQQDPAFDDGILEPLEVLGIEGFRDGQVMIRSRLKTVPQRQAEIGRELRRRVRYALEEAGVDLPPAGLHSVLTRKN